MSSHFSLFVVLLFACDFKTSSASTSYLCRWRTVGDARSLTANACLRLSVYSCDCTGAVGCPGKFYKVERLPDFVHCPAVITWCSWAPWNVHIQTSRMSHTGCEKVSTRQRVCCIRSDDTDIPTQSNLHNSWGCPSNIIGDKQISQISVTCPTRNNNLSVIFISLIVCLFFVTVIIVIVRIFFYKRINAYFHRNSARGIAPNTNRHLSHNPYIQPPPTSPPQITTPPTYTEAMNQMPKLPSYDELLNDPNFVGNATPHTQSATVAATATCSTQSNTINATSPDNNIDNPSGSGRDENTTDFARG